MRTKTTTGVLFLLLALASSAGGGCKDNTVTQNDNDTTNYNTTDNVSQAIGAQGGSVVNAAIGARADFPAGALSKETTIKIGQLSNREAFPLPAGTTAVSRVVSFEPRDQTFALPVTVTLTHTAGSAAAVKLLRVVPGAAWAEVASETRGAEVLHQASSFGFYVVTTSSAGPLTPIPQAEYPAKRAAAVCAAAGPCCTSVGLAADNAKCMTAAQSDNPEFRAEAALPGVTYDGAAAAECLNLLQSGKCTFDTWEAVCKRVLVGTKPLGATCTETVQCAKVAGSSVGCQTKSGATTKTCEEYVPQTYKHGVAGEACYASCYVREDGAESCFQVPTGTSGAPVASAGCFVGDGLACDKTTFKCTSAPSTGGDCFNTIECGATGYCRSGKCAPKEMVGGTCNSTEGSQACAAGLYCASTQQCAAMKMDGEACTTNAECIGDCELGKCIPRDHLADESICAPPT